MTVVEDIDTTKPLLHDYMSQQEVAEELGVTVETLRRWRVHGAGPRWFRFGLGMRLMYNRKDVKDWIEEQRNSQTPSATIRGRAQWGTEETVPHVADHVSNKNKTRWDSQEATPRKKSRRPR